MRTMKKNVDNRGFSLIELLIAMTILLIFTLTVGIGIGTAHRRDAERYAKELQNQIQMTQTDALSKTGQWRLALYQDSTGRYYCTAQHSDSAQLIPEDESWMDYGKRTELGRSPAIVWKLDSGTPQSAIAQAGSTLIWQCRFDPETGARISYDGALLVEGTGKTYKVTVYRENGYCEVERQN